ncbi:hypothetical protein HN011_005239 [Eciton burchellii]|nr:hypothetical protein HN011_005239 [Eciton burchellii]
MRHTRDYNISSASRARSRSRIAGSRISQDLLRDPLLDAQRGSRLARRTPTEVADVCSSFCLPDLLMPMSIPSVMNRLILAVLMSNLMSDLEIPLKHLHCSARRKLRRSENRSV